LSAGSLTVGLVQMSMSAAAADNDRAAENGIREAASRGAKLICLPELYRSRYFCQSQAQEPFALAEPVPGPATESLAELAAELDVAIVASLFEKRAAGLYHNTAAVIDGAAGYAGKYRKMHIPDDPRYYEKYYFAPGDTGFRSFATAAGKIGVLICWDQWFPEAARLTALAGADVLVYPTAIGWHPEEREALGSAQHDSWELIQRSHAVANGCFVIAVNRVGFEPDPAGSGGIEFWGQSFVAGPDGRILTRAGSDGEAVLVETLDLNEIETARVGWPFLRDRRIDAYDGLTERLLDE
jgi:N-carbamoylputrescine amidase